MSEPRRWDRTLVTVARVALGGYLALLGLAFLVHGRHGFLRYGVSDAIRVALGACEVAAGLLFAWTRTARVGAAALVVVLAFAAGLHAGLHEGFGMLLVWGAAAALLGLASSVTPVRPDRLNLPACHPEERSDEGPLSSPESPRFAEGIERDPSLRSG